MTFEGFMPKTAYLPHEIKIVYPKIKQNSLHTLINDYVYSTTYPNLSAHFIEVILKIQQNMFI